MTTITMEKHILKRLDALEDFAKEIRAALAAPATVPNDQLLKDAERKPMTDEDIMRIYGLSKSTTDFARNIELFIAEGTP